jgi:hypothetical protein
MPSSISESRVSESENILDLCSLISKNGFLPAVKPLKRLPDTYYQPWEQILDNLPILLVEKTIRYEISKLGVLTTVRLNTEREWQRAYMILCFLTHGYIWGGDTPSEVRTFTRYEERTPDLRLACTTRDHNPSSPSLRSSRPPTSSNFCGSQSLEFHQRGGRLHESR